MGVPEAEEISNPLERDQRGPAMWRPSSMEGKRCVGQPARMSGGAGSFREALLPTANHSPEMRLVLLAPILRSTQVPLSAESRL